MNASSPPLPGPLGTRASQILAAAASVAATQEYPASTLYMVATPIGNLADLSLRAIHTLARCDAVACEDTRVSAGLLSHLGLHETLLAVHDHNERDAAAQVITRLQLGERVAYVSDAGTPGVSDPGAALVTAVRAAGFRCLPLPGPSAVTTAISVTGLGPSEPTDDLAQGYHFIGFLPSKAAARQAALDAALANPWRTVLFEAPHRIEQLGAALASACPTRWITIGRELTKQFETVTSMAAGELPAWISADANRLRGEFVVVIHALEAQSTDARPAHHDKVLTALLAAMPLKQAVAVAVEVLGAPRNELYARALALKAST